MVTLVAVIDGSRCCTDAGWTENICTGVTGKRKKKKPCVIRSNNTLDREGS